MNLTKFIIKSNKSVGLDQYSSFGENKVDTIYCSSPFSLQTFDILRISHENRTWQNLCFLSINTTMP